MGLAIFEDYSQSTEGTNYAPFLVSISQYQCYEKLLKWVKENSFIDIEPNSDYGEIFAKQGEFEITFIVTSEEDKALVNVSVYGPRGKTRKKLKEILNALVKYYS